MAKSILVSEQITAGERLIREFSKAMAVQAAFWVRERESDEWYLYLVSDQVNDANVDVAYREVLRLVPPDQSFWLDPFQVKVIGADAPIAKAALDIMKNYPATIPTRYHGRQLGNVSIDEVCLYPLPLPVST